MWITRCELSCCPQIWWNHASCSGSGDSSNRSLSPCLSPEQKLDLLGNLRVINRMMRSLLLRLSFYKTSKEQPKSKSGPVPNCVRIAIRSHASIALHPGVDRRNGALRKLVRQSTEIWRKMRSLRGQDLGIRLRSEGWRCIVINRMLWTAGGKLRPWRQELG